MRVQQNKRSLKSSLGTQRFAGASDFSRPEKYHSRGFSIFCVFTQARSKTRTPVSRAHVRFCQLQTWSLRASVLIPRSCSRAALPFVLRPWWTQRDGFVPQMMLTSRRAQARARGELLRRMRWRKSRRTRSTGSSTWSVSARRRRRMLAATPWKRQPARCVICASRK